MRVNIVAKKNNGDPDR